jgi:molybdenum cofactor synthesis domain-containing protein
MDVKAKVFTQYVSVDEALDNFFKEVPIRQLGEESIPILDSLGRVLSEDVYAPVDVPPFDRAAVDGFALKAENTYGASPSNPVVFDVVGSSEMGQVPSVRVNNFEAARIFTGAPLPEGTNSVVMLEYTNEISADKIEAVNAVTPWRNASKRGEDIKKNEKVLARGLVLRSQDIGIIASVGRRKVMVARKPRIAVLSTGNELVEPTEDIPRGKIIDSNKYSISSAVKEAGADPIMLRIARDDPSEIRSRLDQGCRVADMIITIGATSVGSKDYLPNVVKSMGKPGIIVHGISMKPGSPTALAAVNGKPVVLLPGNPAAAFISFFVFVRKIIGRMLGLDESIRNLTIRASLTRRVPSTIGMRNYVRVFVKKSGGSYLAEPIRIAGAGILSSVTKANGLLVIPEDREGFERGEEVDIVILRDIWGDEVGSKSL